MPKLTRYRKWCTTCQNYELHDYKSGLGGLNDEMFCLDCKTEYTPTPLSNIPEEKVLAQRKRYKEYKKNSLFSIFDMYMGSLNPLKTLFEDGPQTEVVEDDAGQAAIDERNKEIEAEKQAERDTLKKESAIKINSFDSLGRNEKCTCGSGLKYKKCCFGDIESLKKTFPRWQSYLK